MLKNAYHYSLQFDGLRAMLRNCRAQMQAFLGYSDPYHEIAAIARRSRADFFLDIGCHRGDTLLRFIEAGVSARCFAFDPQPQNLEIEKNNLIKYSKHTEFIRSALSDYDGKACFYVNANEQTSSLLPNAKGNTEAFPEDTKLAHEMEVSVMRLDSWILTHDPQPKNLIIKCDTQGAEGRVIKGGLETIRRVCCAFYGEVMLGPMYEGQSSFEELRLLLEEECGMVLKNIYPCLHDAAGRAVQMDVLWVKPEYLS